MFQAIRKHLTPSTFIAFMALVFALTGGAFAASSHTGGSGAKASASATHATPVASAAKAKAAPKGKAGPRGPAGAKGATGATGAPGATGPGGPAGATGPGGPQGPPGVTGATGATGAAGPAGAAGKEGKQGVIHPGETLPSGATETGQWILTGSAAGGFELAGAATLSFPIPLKEPLANTTSKVIHPGEGEHEPNESSYIANHECGGTVENPVAAPGFLCIFVAEEENVQGFSVFDASAKEPNGNGAGKTGVGMKGITKEAGVLNARGSWAVTAG